MPGRWFRRWKTPEQWPDPWRGTWRRLLSRKFWGNLRCVIWVPSYTREWGSYWAAISFLSDPEAFRWWPSTTPPNFLLWTRLEGPTSSFTSVCNNPNYLLNKLTLSDDIINMEVTPPSWIIYSLWNKINHPPEPSTGPNLKSNTMISSPSRLTAPAQSAIASPSPSTLKYFWIESWCDWGREPRRKKVSAISSSSWTPWRTLQKCYQNSVFWTQ